MLMETIYKKYTLGVHGTVRFLLPEKRGECGSLHYRFTVQSLDQAVHYAALSYVWGDPKCCGAILIDGVVNHITQNLLFALEKIDKLLESNIKEGDSGPILLWADQVCIDQSNLDERASQVSMMGSIYSRAERVFACLGDSDAAEDVASMVEQVTCLIEGNAARYDGLLKIPPMDSEGLAIFDQFNWAAFRDMLLLPYFSRVWIIQEIGLSRHGVVLYGNCHFTLDRLMLLLAWLSHPGHRIRQLHGLSGWTTHQIWVSFDADKRDNTATSVPLDFLDILSNVSYRYKASDSRDYIFGLLCHPSVNVQSHEQAPTQSLIVRPDYRATVETVFLDFAISWLKYTSKPYLLSCVNHAPPIACEKVCPSSSIPQLDLPSWCPRWDYNPLGGTRLSVERTRSWYAASADSSFCFRLRSRSRLEVKGIIYDEIAQTFPSLDEVVTPIGRQIRSGETDLTGQELSVALKLSYLCGRILQCMSLKFSLDDEDIMFDFASTVLAGSWNYTDTISDRVAQVANIKAISGISNNGNMLAIPDEFTLALETLQSRCKQLEPLGTGGNIASFVKNTQYTMSSRRLFLTKRGCVGLGSAIVSPGNVCCIIAGANVPYILRPSNHETYSMVGECYVQSIMHGEAVRKPDGQMPHWCEVLLR